MLPSILTLRLGVALLCSKHKLAPSELAILTRVTHVPLINNSIYDTMMKLNSTVKVSPLGVAYA